MVSKGEGRWMRVEVGLSYPKSIGLSGPEISAYQQSLRADHSRSAQGATPKPTLRAAWLGRLHQNILAPQSPWREHQSILIPPILPKYSSLLKTTSQSNLLDHTKHSGSRDSTVAH